MAKKQVLIVGRTRMGNTGRACVGGLTQDGESVRLMDLSCSSSFAVQSQYQLGEIWELAYEPCGEHRPPHLEDVAVSESRKVGQSANIVTDIQNRATIWYGGIESLFGGLVEFTGQGSAYIGESNIPPAATGFWIPKSDLNLEQDNRGSRYVLEGGYYRLKYVGFQEPLDTIPAGTLVRISLARWWKPDNAEVNFEERCYGQLSGWY